MNADHSIAAQIVGGVARRSHASGILVLAYSVPGGVGPAPRIRYIKKAAKQLTDRGDADRAG